LVWFEGTDDSTPRYLTADQQGSITAVTDGNGNMLAINTYNEYGLPLSTNNTYQSRFGYTGQVYLPEVALYNYKARMYAPTIGRFLQTDPIGYGNGMNRYAYVGNDPVNRADPTGKLWMVTGTYCPSGGTPSGTTVGGEPVITVVACVPQYTWIDDSPRGPAGGRQTRNDDDPPGCRQLWSGCPRMSDDEAKLIKHYANDEPDTCSEAVDRYLDAKAEYQKALDEAYAANEAANKELDDAQEKGNAGEDPAPPDIVGHLQSLSVGRAVDRAAAALDKAKADYDKLKNEGKCGD
jgi:RHS repeat-associated protein